MNREALDDLKQQIRLLDYLQAHDWRPARQLSHGRLMGLCPLHADHEPSFLVDPRKSLFYCYGCGRGGDVIRFAELFHQVKFPQALSLLRQWHGIASLLHEVAVFYCMQLQRHSEAVAYLSQRGIHSPEVLKHMRIGYAPGGCLRGWLTELGYPVQALRQAGLVTAAGYDTFTSTASCSPWKAISMAAACLSRHHRIVSCQVPRVACTRGTRRGPILR